MSRLVLRGLLLTVFAAAAASAQTIDFRLTANENGQSAIIPNDSSLPLSAAVGTSATATVTATYIGTSAATITQPLQYLGSNEFSVTSSLTPLPQTLTPGQSFTLTITYNPTTAAQADGTVTVTYTEPGSGTNAAPVQNQIVIGLVGTAPQFQLGYVLETSKNFVSISSGGTVPFGATQINTTATADLDINNNGSGTGVITAITQPPAGSPFQVQGIPQLPYGLTAGTGLTLVVTYTPTAVKNDTASIQITFQGGITETVNFSGSGITSTFSYKVLVQGKSTAVTPGSTITFPSVNPGSSSSLILTVTNTGSASGTINSVSTSPPFTLTNPITLPVTLTSGNSFSVPLTFTPTQVGTQTAPLVVGNDFFTLTGQGLGPNLTYTYSSNGATNTVTPPNGVVLFNTIPVGQFEKVTFTITNSGSLPATVSVIGTSSTNNEFTVPTIGAQTLKPNQPYSFPITFTPTVTGLSTGTLVVNSTSISLEGNATAPTTLPSYTITGPSGTVAPQTQSNVSLTLSKPYSLALTGTLTLTTQGVLEAILRCNSRMAHELSISLSLPAAPAPTSRGRGTEILLQTGTVAETVTLTPTFATTAGTDLTPSSPPILQFTVPSEAPVLEFAAVSNEGTSSFDLILTGYSTTRSLTTVNVTFTANSGYNIQTTIPPIDISQASTAWFTSSGSAAFGGQFQITVPFVLQGKVKAGQALIESIASVLATVSNGVGTSGPVSAIVQ